MKKSRIIIPALAVMALSMGAAVTSTVAWFTANRNASATSSPITLINPEGGLDVKATAGAGTTTSDTAYGTKQLAITHSGDFRDGSVDLANGVVYGSNLDINGELTSGSEYKTIESPYLGGQSYYAQNYKITFRYGSDTTKLGYYGLFFDGTKSGINAEGDDPDASKGPMEPNKNTNKGLRVGFKTTQKYLAFAPSKHIQLNEEDTYVSGTHATSTYTANSLTADGTRVETFQSSAASPTLATTQNCIGIYDFHETASATEIEVTVWVWFEGSYETIDNQSTDLANELQLDLAFNVVEYKQVA